MTNEKERVFSVELGSRRDLKNVTLAETASEKVTMEGTIGTLLKARFMEDVILEVTGTKGVLRIDIGADDITEDEE